MAKETPKVPIPKYTPGDLVFDKAAKRQFVVKAQAEEKLTLIYRGADNKLHLYEASALSVRMSRAGWAASILNDEKKMLDALVGT